MKRYVNNYDALNISPLRSDALSIVEAAYTAIDTTEVIKQHVLLEGTTLMIADKKFDLDTYNRIFVIGFGKASCKAVQSLEEVIDGYITGGIVIDKNPGLCKVVRVYQGAHPLPTKENVQFSDEIAGLANEVTEHDLVIVVVSGGGSALLCWPLSECNQGNDLYDQFIEVGATIEELNTVRKHISLIKGGGLAKLLYPGTVVSLIFSDVPGDYFRYVASGPTYYDETTTADAQKVLDKYAITTKYTLNETPKDKKYFEKVFNIPIVSNTIAIKKMEDIAKMLGYVPKVLSTEAYDDPETMLASMKELSTPGTVILVGGELSVKVQGEKGVGGRNEYTAARALSLIAADQIFVSFASDGIDNCSLAAGALVDGQVVKDFKEKIVSIDSYISTNKEDDLFRQLSCQIITGPTGSNVSDLLFLLREKSNEN